MAGPTLETIFGVRTLTDMIQTFSDDSYDKFFYDLFRKGTRINPEGNTFEWDEYKFKRIMAPVVGRDAPAPQSPLEDRVNRSMATVDVKLYKEIPASKLYRERMLGSLRPDAQQVIASELKGLRLRIQKTIEYMCVNTLLGSLTINSTNIEGTTVSYPAISWSPTTYSKSNAWSSANTLILSAEIPSLMQTAIQNSMLQPRIALISPTTETYLLANTEVTNFVKQTANAVRFLQNNVLDPRSLDGMKVGGLEFRADWAGYIPTGGSFTAYMPDGKAIVLPAEDQLGEVLGLAEGYGVVPRNLWGPEGDIGIEELPPGFYAYAEAMSNPVGVRLFAGWVGMPLLKFPAGVTVATLT